MNVIVWKFFYGFLMVLVEKMFVWHFLKAEVVTFLAWPQTNFANFFSVSLFVSS